MAKKPHCIFTYVHDEPLWWPVWCGYYSRFFKTEDIFVIHFVKPRRTEFDGWFPGWAAARGITVFQRDDPVHCDDQYVVDKVMQVQRDLLDEYEMVWFCELDEILCSPAGFQSWIDHPTGKPTLRATGYEVVHMHKEYPDFGVANAIEEPIDWTQPLLAQREWWYPTLFYSKPVASRVPLIYAWGFHTSRDTEKLACQPGLILLHLHRLDYQTAVDRRKKRIRNESKPFKKGDPGMHHRLLGKDLDNWWFSTVDKPGSPAPFEPMPDWVRSVI